MTTETILTLEQIIEFCNAKWQEARETPSTGWPPPDMQTGKKIAFNEVLQFARTLLPETP